MPLWGQLRLACPERTRRGRPVERSSTGLLPPSTKLPSCKVPAKPLPDAHRHCFSQRRKPNSRNHVIHPESLPHKNALLARLLRNLAFLAAPIPVTLLWTPCTPLKIRNLQTHNFR